MTFRFHFITTALNCRNFSLYNSKRKLHLLEKNIAHVKQQRHARAVKYVGDTLRDSFDVERCTEGSYCSLAISDNNGRYLPIWIASSLMTKSKSGRYIYRFRVSHKKNCVAILVGAEDDSQDLSEHNTSLWYVDAAKMKQMKFSTTIQVTLGCNSDKKMPRVHDLKQFVANQLRNQSLLDTHDGVMRKNGETVHTSIKNGAIGERFSKSCLEKAGFEVEIPEVGYQPTDMVLHKIVDDQPISLNIQIKYTSWKAPRNIDHVYKVHAEREVKTAPFRKGDYDIFFVCLKTSDSKNINFVYCIPASVMADAKILCCSQSNIKGKKCFYLAPMLSPNDHEKGKHCKYYYLNKYQIHADDPDFQELIELAAREKLQRIQSSLA